MVDRLVRQVRAAGIGAVVAPTAPSDPVALGEEAVEGLHAGALDAAQHRDVPMRQHLAEAQRVHTPGDREPATALVRPEPHLRAGERRGVRQERRRGVEAHPVAADRGEPRAVAREQAQSIVAHHAARAEQQERDRLVRDGVDPRRQGAAAGATEREARHRRRRHPRSRRAASGRPPR